MNSFPFFMVNAFGNGPQSGNPAGVCFLDEWKSTHELQSFASQVCLPETAFVIPSKKNNWAIRWFSTSHEVDLCGHATLAAAYCLSKTNDIQEINFSSKSGVLKTIVHSDETVSITLPASHARTSKLSAQLVEGLGAYPELSLIHHLSGEAGGTMEQVHLEIWHAIQQTLLSWDVN